MTSSVYGAGCMSELLETGNINKVLLVKPAGKKNAPENPLNIGQDNINMISMLIKIQPDATVCRYLFTA